MKILYTTEAVVQGGRAGHGRTADGRLTVQLSAPRELGGEGGPGTNPEELFAIGYAACFQSGLLSLAHGRKLDASNSTITSRVGDWSHRSRRFWLGGRARLTRAEAELFSQSGKL
jgi:Ohr subfamily peroxiredoxin